MVAPLTWIFELFSAHELAVGWSYRVKSKLNSVLLNSCKVIYFSFKLQFWSSLEGVQVDDVPSLFSRKLMFKASRLVFPQKFWNLV